MYEEKPNMLPESNNGGCFFKYLKGLRQGCVGRYKNEKYSSVTSRAHVTESSVFSHKVDYNIFFLKIKKKTQRNA